MLLCACVAAVQTYTGWTWGLPGHESWAVDSVGGVQIVEWVQGGMRYEAGFPGRYTPVHKYALAAVYAPVVGWYWASGEDGQTYLVDSQAFRTALLRVARLLSVLMAVGVLVTLFVIGDRLGPPGAGLLAAGCWAGTYAAVYLSQTSNLDVPYLFWTLLALERLLAFHRTGRARSLAAAAVLAGIAVGTKESAAGLILAFPVLLAWSPLREGATGRFDARQFLGRAVSWSAISASTYALLCQVFFRPANYFEHVRTLFSIASELKIDQLRLLSWFGREFANAAHPVVIFMLLAGSVATLLKRPRTWSWLMLPVVSYHLVFVVKTQIMGARYILPHLTVLSLMAGLAGASVLSRWPRARRVAIPILALVCYLSGASMNVALWNDPRATAQHWLERHPEALESLATHCTIDAYLPTAAQREAERVRVVDRRPGVVRARYLVCVSTYYVRFLWTEDPEDPQGWNALLAGKLGFEPVARFDGLSLGFPWVDITRRRPTIPGFAQSIRILRRKEPAKRESQDVASP